MSEDAGRLRDAVLAAAAEKGLLSAQAQAKAFNMDDKTLRTFLDGTRRPHQRTIAKVEQVLGWAPGAINTIRRGGPVPKSATFSAPPAIGHFSPSMQQVLAAAESLDTGELFAAADVLRSIAEQRVEESSAAILAARSGEPEPPEQ